MQPWAQGVLIACAVVLTAALVAAMLALRRTLARTEAVLAIVEQELRPLVGQVHGLTDEFCDGSRCWRFKVTDQQVHLNPATLVTHTVRIPGVMS